MTDLTLQEKAQIALEARDAGDPRWLLPVLVLAQRLDMPPPEVAIRIERLAATGIA